MYQNLPDDKILLTKVHEAIDTIGSKYDEIKLDPNDVCIPEISGRSNYIAKRTCDDIKKMATCPYVNQSLSILKKPKPVKLEGAKTVIVTNAMNLS